MPQFFIDRPVFAWVVAILIALGGLLALMRLPAEAYPEIAPPQVAVSTTYPGASAATVETTVTQVIEQQLTGLDNLLYFTSQSASDGSAAIVLTFATGTSADIAAVQTQNRVTLAQPRLPAEVNQQGIRIAKVSAGFLGAIGLRSAAGGPGAEGRFRTPEQFETILLRTEPNGASVRLRDVARVTLGAAQYGFETRIGATPVAAFGIQLAPNANALDVAKAVEARMNNIAPSFPAGVSWFWAFDSTTFIKVAIREVIVTLTEAVALVFLVMLVFLQSFRATLIPTLVVPSALLGTLVGMYAVGFSINQLSLFAMVLAIGIVVDDAIVVVEAVERIMREEQLPPKAATRKAMQQITGAIVAITSVLAAVFIPSALQSGSTGVIYRQFALTIALSMGFSALLPAGASLPRTREVLQHINAILTASPDVSRVFLIAGSSFTGTGENAARAFIKLKPWDERPDKAADFIRWANEAFAREIHDAKVYALNLPTVRGLGVFGGFDLYLEDRGGLGREALAAAQRALLDAAARQAAVTGARANLLPPAPQLRLTVDRVQAQSMGLSSSDVYTALQLMLAPVYANDFVYQGRLLRVLLQADSPWRMTPEALGHFYVAGAGGMIPLANVVRAEWMVGAPSLTRYNGYPAVEITGANASGHSSGEAMQAMQTIIDRELPRGFGNDWAGQSLQELISGAQAPMLFALSILVVYLCLAALYESWSIPAAVLLAVPVGLIGSTVAALLRGLPNDVFFKVGLITIIGLSAKNAILIVEFAVTLQREGRTLHQAVLEAARLRFRPILMTSFAFILGVFPMAVSSGAGANARHAIGTGVVGGMLSA